MIGIVNACNYHTHFVSYKYKNYIYIFYISMHLSTLLCIREI
jgi:hypothetical protein